MVAGNSFYVAQFQKTLCSKLISKLRTITNFQHPDWGSFLFCSQNPSEQLLFWPKTPPKKSEKGVELIALGQFWDFFWVVKTFRVPVAIKLFRARQFCCFSHFWIFLFFHFVPKFPLITCGKFDMIESDKGEQSHWNYYCFGSHQMLRWFDRRTRTCRKHFWFGIVLLDWNSLFRQPWHRLW